MTVSQSQTVVNAERRGQLGVSALKDEGEEEEDRSKQENGRAGMAAALAKPFGLPPACAFTAKGQVQEPYSFLAGVGCK